MFPSRVTAFQGLDFVADAFNHVSKFQRKLFLCMAACTSVCLFVCARARVHK